MSTEELYEIVGDMSYIAAQTQKPIIILFPLSSNKKIKAEILTSIFLEFSFVFFLRYFFQYTYPFVY